MITMTVDPSERGAICVLGHCGDLTLLEKLPVDDAIEGSPRVDVLALRHLIRLVRDPHDIRTLRVVLDRATTSGNALVDGARAVFQDMGITVELAPPCWRDDYGVQSSSLVILAKARLAAPAMRFEGKAAVSLARTLLLARLLWRQSRRPPDDSSIPSAAQDERSGHGRPALALTNHAQEMQT